MDFDAITVMLLWQGERAAEYDDEQLATLQDGHLAHLAHLHDAGALVAAGPVRAGPDSELRGFGLFRVDPDEAKALMEDDPSVRAARVTPAFVRWMVPAGAISFSHTRFPRSIADVRGD